jgi:tuftelin-interacting protein 11
VADLQVLGIESQTNQEWDAIVDKLETLEFSFRDELETYGLSEVAVASLHPFFGRSMEAWDPLENPTYITTYLRRLHDILDIKSVSDVKALSLKDVYYSRPRQSKSTTPYETMIYTLWLPKVRSAITNSWNPHDPSPLILLVEAWKDILPEFVHAHLIDQLIVPRLASAVKSWNPRISSRKHRSSSSSLPHHWLFPWLPYLPAHHIDPKAPTSLLSDVKRKFRIVIDTWDLTHFPIPGLSNWREVLRTEFDHLMVRHLLPRLAAHLQTHFQIDPADQEPYQAALDAVLAWCDFFKPSITGQLLVAEFFPLWHSVLYQWLVSDGANFEEIGTWFTWWKSVIPAELSAVPAVAAEWERGLEMINYALDLGPENKHRLPPPQAGPARPMPTSASTSSAAPTPNGNATPVKAQTSVVEDGATFRDVLEAWCMEENLLLMPLREAHEVTGLPLFRITASANGKGGVIVYLKGDVVWAQRKGEKGIFEPIGLGDKLIERAEGR